MSLKTAHNSCTFPSISTALFFFIATVLTNILITVILKLFTQFRIDSLQAIVANYCVCVITGCLFTGHSPFTAATLARPWLPWTIVMGFGFIGAFNLMAWCAQRAGITTMALANKLSLVIPVIVAIVVFGEHAGTIKIIGLVLAIPAIWLINRSQSGNNNSTLLWPALLFLVSGSLDTLVNYIQSTFLAAPEDQALCTIVCFATAGSIGILLVFTLAILGKIKLAFRNIIAGIALGIPNFFSIYFLVKALRSHIFQSSATIPLLNISILVATALVAIFAFREKAGLAKLAGLIIAIASILMIGLGDT